MRNKRTDEWRTQRNITTRLNKMTRTDNRAERQRIREELRELTYDFWYQKFKLIRDLLQGEGAAQTKCRWIQKIIDTPRDGLIKLLMERAHRC